LIKIPAYNSRGRCERKLVNSEKGARISIENHVMKILNREILTVEN